MSDRTEDDWTPYGLERFRQSRLWRRRMALAALVLVVAVAYVGFLQFGFQTSSQTTISTIGGSGGSVTLDAPDQGRPTPDATIGLSPGELNVAPSAIQTEEDGEQGVTPSAPEGQRPAVQPIHWPTFLVRWGLPVGLLALGFLLGRGRDQEVNYGVYKGAMPMEKISARYSHLVKTSRATYRDPFGKRRPDYVPDADENASTDEVPAGGDP